MQAGNNFNGYQNSTVGPKRVSLVELEKKSSLRVALLDFGAFVLPVVITVILGTYLLNTVAKCGPL